MATATELRTVGRTVAKPDAWLKATGTATYAGDIRLAGMLESRVLRSPYAHARINSIDTSAAEALPGVFAVVCGRDVPEQRIGNGIRDRHALARDKVIYVGEPIAAVAAVNEETAAQALELIRVEYEPLPAVLDPQEALAPDSPAVHPDLQLYQGADELGEGNVRSRIVHEAGDIASGFGGANVVIHEATYRTPRQSPGATEPHAAIAQVDPSGRVTVWASIKAPFRARECTADTLGIPLSHVRIISPLIGGDFGGKGGGFVEPIVALLARRARRPVRLALSRTEELTAMLCRPAYIIKLRIAARRDGTLVALDADMLCDSGAVDDYGPDRFTRAASLIGPYRIPHARVVMTAVYTNTSPTGHVRAPSGPQYVFALESHIDAMAHILNVDPFEFRLKNLLHDGERVPTGRGVLSNSGLEECIARARRWIEALPAKRTNQGIGVAISSWSMAPKPVRVESAAAVKIDVDGSVVVLSGVSDQGGGQWSMVAQVASEVLGVPMDRISVIAADTDATPFELGTSGSNITYRVGTVVRQAAEDARRKLLRVAAELLQVDEEELTLRDGEVLVEGDLSKKLSIASAAQAAMGAPGGAIIGTSTPTREEEIRAHGEEQARIVDTPSLACHVAVVDVDEETGRIDVRRYFAAHDVGRALNPQACIGQIEGGVVFGLGYALSEELIARDGANANANLWEYLLPTAPHVPDLAVELVEFPSTYGPFGAKGIGESPCIAVAAAVANALADATGIRLTEIPLTPERVLSAIKAPDGP